MSTPKDPAAVDVQLSIAGLTRGEAAALFHSIPPGRAASFAVTQPAAGNPRYAVTLTDYSSVQARDALASLVEHMEAVWDGGDTAAPPKDTSAADEEGSS